jgi:SAM-dependent methyltransferase
MTSSAGFKDLFSQQASDYSKYRPHYPDALFGYLASLCPEKTQVWDCGTGNGQAAVALATHFEKVIATDPSEKQLKSADPHPKVLYRQGTAESSGLADQSMDLVTVAQAFHWFKHADFYREVRRVLKPGAPLAVWCYALCHVTPEFDQAVQELYEGVLSSYWEPERKLVEEGYRDLPFPFREIKSPDFEMSSEWSLERLIGYFSTWSALQKYKQKNASDPLASAYESLKKAWGNNPTRIVKWPLALRVGRI